MPEMSIDSANFPFPPIVATPLLKSIQHIYMNYADHDENVSKAAKSCAKKCMIGI